MGLNIGAASVQPVSYGQFVSKVGVISANQVAAEDSVAAEDWFQENHPEGVAAL
jgi:hypothetical protein